MNTKIYTYSQSVEAINKAHVEVAKYPSYRLGQALWNNLPQHIADYDMETNQEHHKFYNSRDNTFVIDYFYKNFVCGYNNIE